MRNTHINITFRNIPPLWGWELQCLCKPIWYKTLDKFIKGLGRNFSERVGCELVGRPSLANKTKQTKTKTIAHKDLGFLFPRILSWIGERMCIIWLWILLVKLGNQLIIIVNRYLMMLIVNPYCLLGAHIFGHLF